MKTIQRTFLAFLLVALPSFGGDGVAFITNLKGEVAVDGNARPLLLSELAKGQKITLAKDSQVSVMYTSSGKEFVLKGPGDYVVTESEISGAAGAAPVARNTEW